MGKAWCAAWLLALCWDGARLTLFEGIFCKSQMMLFCCCLSKFSLGGVKHANAKLPFSKGDVLQAQVTELTVIIQQSFIRLIF